MVTAEETASTCAQSKPPWHYQSHRKTFTILWKTSDHTADNTTAHDTYELQVEALTNAVIVNAVQQDLAGSKSLHLRRQQSW
jgi:hypothetical protein